MEEYLLFASIGGLLFLTLLMNSIAEAHEIKQREKRIQILKIKIKLDTLSELLEHLKYYSPPPEINNLILNEIISRLQLIQSIDRKFHGIEALIEENNEQQNNETPPPTPEQLLIKTEAEFAQMLRVLRQLIQMLDSHDWVAKVSGAQLAQYVNDIRLLRCEKIFQYHTDKATLLLQENKFLVAKEGYYYTINALKNSGLLDNPRVAELLEQVEFMKHKVVEMMVEHIAQKRLGTLAEDAEQKVENQKAQ